MVPAPLVVRYCIRQVSKLKALGRETGEGDQQPAATSMKVGGYANVSEDTTLT